ELHISLPDARTERTENKFLLSADILRLLPVSDSSVCRVLRGHLQNQSGSIRPCSRVWPQACPSKPEEPHSSSKYLKYRKNRLLYRRYPVRHRMDAGAR